MPVNPLWIRFGSTIHLFWYRMTGGVIGGNVLGMPALLLTTTGRKSGQQRTTPLTYLRDGEHMVLVASNGGNPSHPAWFLNLQANPEAEVQVGVAIVSGQITGNISARERVELRGSARIFGDIVTPILVLEEGVVFDGRCKMKGEELQAAQKNP